MSLISDTERRNYFWREQYNNIQSKRAGSNLSQHQVHDLITRVSSKESYGARSSSEINVKKLTFMKNSRDYSNRV